MIPSSLTIAALHDNKIIEWKQQCPNDAMIRPIHKDLLTTIENNHRYNYQLWHAEDQARREDGGHALVYHAKRMIDQCNQLRNDALETIDAFLIDALNLSPEHHGLPVHSETPGMMIDRLSILALKHYHMKIESRRPSADTAHHTLATQKLQRLTRQRTQLMSCFDELIHDIQEKKRTFMIYYQCKMYNDKNFNPALYKSAES